MTKIIVFDIETALDREAIARVHRIDPQDEAAIKQAVGEGFAKLPFHQIVCIGALLAEYEDNAWHVRKLTAAHAGRYTEAQLLRGFDRLLCDGPVRLVGWNSKSFDLAVLRLRAMMLALAAPGMSGRRYFARYVDDQIDLMDVLANYDGRAKLPLDLVTRALGLRGKPIDIGGGLVDNLAANEDYELIADYCIGDVLLTYQVFLRHELFCARLNTFSFDASTVDLERFVATNTPHLADAVGLRNDGA